MFGLTKLFTWRPYKQHIESTYELEQLPVVPVEPPKPSKIIRVKQCSKVFYMSEEQYKEQVDNYEKFRELLLALCHGGCEDCFFRELRLMLNDSEWYCEIQRYLNPVRNKQEDKEGPE